MTADRSQRRRPSPGCSSVGGFRQPRPGAGGRVEHAAVRDGPAVAVRLAAVRAAGAGSTIRLPVHDQRQPPSWSLSGSASTCAPHVAAGPRAPARGPRAGPWSPSGGRSAPGPASVAVIERSKERPSGSSGSRVQTRCGCRGPGRAAGPPRRCPEVRTRRRPSAVSESQSGEPAGIVDGPPAVARGVVVEQLPLDPHEQVLADHGVRCEVGDADRGVRDRLPGLVARGRTPRRPRRTTRAARSRRWAGTARPVAPPTNTARPPT